MVFRLRSWMTTLKLTKMLENCFITHRKRFSEGFERWFCLNSISLGGDRVQHPAHNRTRIRKSTSYLVLAHLGNRSILDTLEKPMPLLAVADFILRGDTRKMRLQLPPPLMLP